MSAPWICSVPTPGSTAQRPLRIGMTCYPTMGGSGVIATEIGLALLQHGHEVHFICAAVPERLRPWMGGDAQTGTRHPRLHMHLVEVEEYLLPHMGSYPLALAARLAEIGRTHRLDLWHLHYAVPHAVSALLARQLLAAEPSPSAEAAPSVRTVLTLHGTDVTGIGQSPSLRAINRFALLSCDALTVPSQYLKEAAYTQLDLPATRPIVVIPNFVDTDALRPLTPPVAAAAAGRAFTLCHASNFRPLKRIEDVIHTFARVRAATARPLRLLLIGEGPERPPSEALVRSLGLSDDVEFLGFQQTLAEAFARSDVFLLPSQNESFGLAALEAQSCGLPVVASHVGGLPEVIREGETGFLLPVGDVAGMAAAVLRLLADEALQARMRAAARQSAVGRFAREPRIREYEACYRRILETPA